MTTDRGKRYSCKIGTIPSLVIFSHNYKPRVGLVMWVRDAKHGTRPYKIVVTRLGDDSYFFADRL